LVGPVYNGSIWNGSGFKQVVVFDGIIFNSTEAYVISEFNGTILNISGGWALVGPVYNGTVFNSSAGFSWHIIHNWDGLIYNSTEGYPIELWNGTLFNQSLIMISGVYPGNNSFSIPLQPTLYLTVNHSNGNTMNLSFYYGPSNISTPNLLGSFSSQPNGTYNMLDFNASSRFQYYYWRIMVNDGMNWVNETFAFRTEGYANVVPGGNVSSTVFGVIGILGIIGLFSLFLNRRKKRKERHVYRHDDESWRY